MQAKPYLCVDDIDVWFESLVASDADYHNYWRLLSLDEQQVAQRFVNDWHRHRYVVCHGKVRMLLSNYLTIAPESIRFARQAYGKPYLVDASGQPDYLQFNLSHSVDRMLLAVGRHRVGIDLEVWDNRLDLQSLADECLATSEKSYWQVLRPIERVWTFYRFWTRKESFVKAVGVGIGNGVSKIVTSTAGKPSFMALPDSFGNTKNWRLIDLGLEQGISGALTVSLR